MNMADDFVGNQAQIQFCTFMTDPMIYDYTSCTAQINAFVQIIHLLVPRGKWDPGDFDLS